MKEGEGKRKWRAPDPVGCARVVLVAASNTEFIHKDFCKIDRERCFDYMTRMSPLL